MKSCTRVLLLLITAATVLTTSADASGATANRHHSTSPVDTVSAYWTQERMLVAASSAGLLHGVDGLLSGLVSTPLLGLGRGSYDFPAETDGTPWSVRGEVRTSVGRIFLSYGGRDEVCTGTAVQDFRTGESMVVTAGHCVYDLGSKQFATNWMFIPGFDREPFAACEEQPIGCWTASHFVTSRTFANGNLNGDYAFAVIGRGGRDGQTLLEDAVKPQIVAFEREPVSRVYAFGYPSAGQYDGTDLVYCAGLTVVDDWGGRSGRGVRCNMTDGASGGPWMIDFNHDTCAGVVNSVTSFRYAAGHLHEYLFAPYFGAEARRTYVAAQSTTANQIVN